MSAPHPACAPDVPARGEPEDPMRAGRRLSVARALLYQGDRQTSEKLERCPDELFLFACDRAVSDGHPVGLRRFGCDQRLCPSCQPRLRKRRQATAIACVEKANREHPRAQLAHFVLTIPNVERLGIGDLRQLGKTVTKWFRRKVVKDNVLGLYRSLEVTWNNDGGTHHPHVHCLLLLRPPGRRTIYDWGELWRALTMEWHDLTTGGCAGKKCIPKAQSMEPKKDRPRTPDESQARGCSHGGSSWLGEVWSAGDVGSLHEMFRVAREVAKYICKGAIQFPQADDQVDEDVPFTVGDIGAISPKLAQVSRAIRGVRLGLGLGVFFAVKAEEPDAPRYSCPVCVAMAAQLEGDELEAFDPSMRFRGPPRVLRRKAFNDGCEESAVLLALMDRDYPSAFSG